MQFTHWAVQDRAVYGPQLHFVLFTILASIAHSVNLR